jgi:transposase
MRNGGGPGRLELGFVGRGFVIQIAPQVRILVAIKPIDCRKGIDRIAQLCREKLNADPFSGPVYLPQLARNLHPNPPVRRLEGVWLATKAIVQKAFQVVADRQRCGALLQWIAGSAVQDDAIDRAFLVTHNLGITVALSRRSACRRPIKSIRANSNV